ncbi:Zn-dependent exopeptidase, partial [Testicularia cyperi]
MCSPNVHYEHFLSSTPNANADNSAAFGYPTRPAAGRRDRRNDVGRSSSQHRSQLAGTALLQHTIDQKSSVLSLAVDEERNLLYSGSQSGYIHVWDLATFQPSARLEGHTCSVLSLELAPEKEWLFSSSGDNTVRVWDTRTLASLFVIYPAEDNVGDIFSLKWCSDLETLYLGCQSTSIQWICLAGLWNGAASNSNRIASSSATALPGASGPHSTSQALDGPYRNHANGRESPIVSTPDLISRPHKFFDSVPVALSRSGMGTGGTATPKNRGRPSTLAPASTNKSQDVTAASSKTEKVLKAASDRLDDAVAARAQAHTSALLPAQIEAHEQADTSVPHNEARILLIPSTSAVPSAHFGYVYCLTMLTLEGDAAQPHVLASGSGDESIKLWHATASGLCPLATLESPNADGNAVLALASWTTTLFAGLQGGEIEVWDLETCTLVRTIRGHTDDVLCLETCPDSGLLFSASADGTVRKWDRSFRCVDKFEAHDGIVLSLTKIRESPRHPASDDDADSDRGTVTRKRCLFYGHYDCIAAEGSWDSEPFRMDGRDGYLYGRGISDNKGPILAAACAVSKLLTSRRLQTDVVFLIEGEEENGSVGFIEAVRRYKHEIGHIDVILLSNSYWLDEETPCLTIGLRGVVRATVRVSSNEPDVHSGVEGGAIREPMVDMVKLLSLLTEEGRVALPGFYDRVRAVTDEERTAYEEIVRIKQSRSHPQAQETASSLMAKWRFPSLSVHNIRVSGPGNSTVIPSSVSANVSLRIVPDQDLDSIEQSLRRYVETTFEQLSSRSHAPRNRVEVMVDHRADWWLGSTSSRYFEILREAVSKEWNAHPISIREGGSIPAIAILEKELGALAVHLPMGQSSDSAHLPNERIRLVNLNKGKRVVERFLEGLGAL